MKLTTWIADAFSTIASGITWNKLYALFNNGLYYKMTEGELSQVRERLRTGYYLILVRKNAHLTTYLIGIANLFLSGKFSYYAHILMNVEGDDPVTNDDFRLEEAQRSGVQYSTFMQALACDGIALLVPRGFTADDWTKVMDKAVSEYGKAYDTLFDLTNAERVSCVEMVRVALQSVPDYAMRFAHFENMIKTNKNLTPQMFYDCPDFYVAWESRH